MMDKNRFILHLHHNLVLFDYDIIWSYYTVPKLKHLAFWEVIDMLKKLRTKKCWDLHLTFHKFCTTCSTLEMISRLLHFCSDSV